MKKSVVMHRISERHIERVLYYVRAELVRSGGDGVEHANALLKLRGLDPDKYHVGNQMPRKIKGRSGRRRAIIAALKQGKATSYQICQRIALEHLHIDPDANWLNVSSCLSQLKQQGIVENDGAWRYPVWKLT